MFNTNDYLRRIGDDYDFIRYSPRNQARMLHTLRYLGEQVAEIFDTPSYTVSYPRDSVRRKDVDGTYYTKRYPIVVEHNQNFEFLLSCHFVSSSFKKNINNAFERTLGECANVQSNGVRYGTILILQDKCPVLDSHDNVVDWDFLSGVDVVRHINLINSADSAHKPFVSGVTVIQTPENGQAIAMAQLNGFEPATRNQLVNQLPVFNIFRTLQQLRQNLGN